MPPYNNILVALHIKSNKGSDLHLGVHQFDTNTMACPYVVEFSHVRGGNYLGCPRKKKIIF